MKIKNVAFDRKLTKAGPDDGLAEGEFLVYPSTFTRKADSYGDVVAKGAFADDIKAWADSGNVLPGLYGHRMDDPDYFVASALEQGEDDHGWWVKGKFDLESPKGPTVYRLVKGRQLNQLSFAYDVLDSGKSEGEDGETVNELRKLKVYEFSFVPVGANQDTSVVAVKTAVDALQTWPGFKAGRVLSAKNENSLRDARDAIDSVLTALDSEAEDGAPKQGDVNDQEKASDTTSNTADANAQDHQTGGTASVSAKDSQLEPSPVERLAAQATIYALKGAERGSL